MKILVFGGSGLVGSRFVQNFSGQFEIVAPSHDLVDLTQSGQIEKSIYQVKPEYIFYAAGFTNVDLAEEQRDLCNQLNIQVPKTIAQKAQALKTPFCYLSTDYVFDGHKIDAPYTENDTPNPVESVYAKSKKEGEEVVLAASKDNLVVRLIMPFSSAYAKKLDLARLVLEKLQNGESVSAITDQKINPIFVDDLVMAISLLIKNLKSGIYHIGATDYVTPYGFIKKIAEVFNLDQNLITPITFEEFSETRKAKRPQYTWLDTTKFRQEFGEGILHSIDDELNRFKEGRAKGS